MSNVAQASQGRLLLFFDVNKTVLMSDASSGKGMTDMLRSLITECVWGEITDAPEGAEWKCISDVPDPSTPTHKEGVVLSTFSDFIENKYAYKEGAQEEEYNASIKKLRKKLKLGFVDTESGRKFESAITLLQNGLNIPDNEKEAFMSASKLFQSGTYYLLPSFLHCLRTLIEQGTDFQLIFRTYGTDIAEVAEEMNLFATGKHPKHPGFVGGDRVSVDLETASGTFFRTGHADDETYLVMGTIEQVDYANPGIQHYKDQGDAVKVLSGMDDIFKHIHDWKGGALGLRDYYPWWRDNAEECSAGKPFRVYKESSSLSIFFDDNIERNDMHIVDVRDSTGKQIPLNEALNKYIVKAEPWLAIQNQNYFLEAIDKCRKNVQLRDNVA